MNTLATLCQSRLIGVFDDPPPFLKVETTSTVDCLPNARIINCLHTEIVPHKTVPRFLETGENREAIQGCSAPSTVPHFRPFL